MNLGQLIDALEQHPDQDAVVPEGFANPHSYRGYYDCLAFEPVRGLAVRQLLAEALSADGAVYEGWKGGDYRMERGTEVYIATEGSTGDEFSDRLLRYMLAAARPASAPAPEPGLLTLPAEPPEGVRVRIVGGNSDGQEWERRDDLYVDGRRWRRRRGVDAEWVRWSSLWWRLTEDDGEGQVGLRIVPQPLEVGDAVTTAAQLAALPEDAVIRDNISRLLVRGSDGPDDWREPGVRMGDQHPPALGPASRVLDLPGGAS